MFHPESLKNCSIFTTFVAKNPIMKNKITVGILKETKTPPDRRVPIGPRRAREILNRFPNVELTIQSSDIRCFADNEYSDLGLLVSRDVSTCDMLMGVKEVHIPELIPEKTYLFFSHTAKKQAYNRSLLQHIVEKKITLIDYEYLTDHQGFRLVAFGRWAGIVGAYNGLRAWGERFGDFTLKPAHECHDLEEMLTHASALKLPPLRILITGGGRVAHGAMETLAPLNIKEVPPADFLHKKYSMLVFCRLDPWHYTRRKDGSAFGPDGFNHFIQHPQEYESTFLPYTRKTDLFIAAHFWDPQSPVFMKPEDYLAPGFSVQVIADISCDIKKPIPSTLRASTIAEPFYGYDPRSGKEGDPLSKENITVMAVDNLPGELPRDASVDFGKALIDNVFPSLFGKDREKIIERATIVKHGKLTRRFGYLKEFLEGKE
jgi:saccharopine dehydrogenase (NAD+, L-lysine-forming)